MKNRLVIMLFCLTLVLSLAAQVPLPPFSKNTTDMQIVDSAYFCIYYAFNATDIDKEETYDDLQRLEVGKHLSKYYSYFIFYSDSISTEWRKKNLNATSIHSRIGIKGKNSDVWSEYHYSEYFKDFLCNKLTEYIRMPAFLSDANSQYSEEIPKQKWEIKDDTSTIANYLCQKAECFFRGRHFTAWFSVQIPINNGPWKFGGLPGLILKVSDDQNLYVFECVKIETINKKRVIKKFNDFENYKVVERAKFLKFKKDVHENYAKVAGLVIHKGLFPQNGKYCPIELE
jgi:GLPGLI family protein